jgi:phage shock protein A
MKITELAAAVTGMPMGDDPVKAIDDMIKQKTEQLQALQKEIADLKTSKPQAQAAVQQQKAQQATQGTQGTQQQQGGATAPAMNTQIQPTPVQPS